MTPRLFEPDGERTGAGFSTRDFLSFVFKHGTLILLCLLLVTIVTFYGASRQPKIYTATGHVWVKTDQQGTPSFLSGVTAYRDAMVQESPSRRLETEMSALLAPGSVEAVIRRNSLSPELLKLTPLEVLVRPYVPSLTRFGLTLKAWFGVKPEDEPPVDPQAATVKAFMNSIAMAPLQSKGAQDTSNIIEVKLSGTDPEVTRRALTSLLEEYIAHSTEQELELGKKALEALKMQTGEAQSELETVSAEIVAYVTGSAAMYLAADNPALSGGADAPTAPAGIKQASPSITAKLRADTEEAQSRLDTLRQVYTDRFPAVEAARHELEDLRVRMQSEGRSSTLASARLGVLERRRGIAQQRFVELRHKLDQIGLYLKMVPTEVQGRLITDAPRQAIKDSALLKLITIVIGPVAGLLLGLALASLLELIDRRLQTREAVSKYLGLETLAVLPTFIDPAPRKRVVPAWSAERLGKMRERRTRMNDPSGQIDGLGLSIAQRMPQGDTGFTLLVTSARAGEGKSFVATRLAERMVSLLAAPVLIVEANAENPSVHLSFPGAAEGGLFDCLRAEELLPERIDATATARLSAMAAPCGAQMSLLFHMRSMRRILDALRDQFALTIIDAATLPQVGCLAQQADATLLVVDAAHTRRDIVQGAMASPHIARERIMGVVLNRRPEYVPPWLYKGLL